MTNAIKTIVARLRASRETAAVYPWAKEMLLTIKKVFPKANAQDMGYSDGQPMPKDKVEALKKALKDAGYKVKKGQGINLWEIAYKGTTKHGLLIAEDEEADEEDDEQRVILNWFDEDYE
jgi:anti-sigma28 factor (negative regulator of flagellin synthesis)